MSDTTYVAATLNGEQTSLPEKLTRAYLVQHFDLPTAAEVTLYVPPASASQPPERHVLERDDELVIRPHTVVSAVSADG